MSSSSIPEPALDENRILKVLAHAALGRRLLPTAWIVNGRCSCSVELTDESIICQQGNKAGKHPLITDWQHRASNDQDVILDWYRWRPRANWGWLQDKTFALDVDPKRGGLDSLAQWEENAGGPNPTLTQRTQSGGFHFVYKQPEGGMRTEGDMLPGIEIRATGAYIMIDPSTGLTGAWTLVDPDRAIEEADEFTLQLIAKHGLDFSGDGVERRGRGRKRDGGERGESDLPPTDYFMKNGFGGHTGSRNKDAYRLAWRLLAHGDSKPGMYTTTRIAGIMKTCWLATDQGDAPFGWDECIGALQSAYRRRERQKVEDAKDLLSLAASLIGGEK